MNYDDIFKAAKIYPVGAAPNIDLRKLVDYMLSDEFRQYQENEIEAEAARLSANIWKFFGGTV